MKRRKPYVQPITVPCTGCIRRGLTAEQANRVRKHFVCNPCADLEEGVGF